MNYCSWCENEILSMKIQYCQSESSERHILCPSCHLNGHACQSSCPSCWYDLAEKFLEKENICSSCFQSLNEIEYKLDKNAHKICFLCSECVLCLFRRQTEKEFFYLSYREHDYPIQKMLYKMQNCVQKMEYDSELCSICMDLLNDPMQIEILKDCKHRFHRNCIAKWFEQKSCCPCCRHVYHNHDQPKPKRMRIQIN